MFGPICVFPSYSSLCWNMHWSTMQQGQMQGMMPHFKTINQIYIDDETLEKEQIQSLK